METINDKHFISVQVPDNIGLSTELRDLIEQMLIKNPLERITLPEIKVIQAKFHITIVKTNKYCSKITANKKLFIKANYP